MAETLGWLALLELAGLAALPLASRVFRAWPDQGYAMAKFLGLLLIGYAAWLTAMLGLTGFTAPTIAVLGALLAVWAWAGTRGTAAPPLPPDSAGVRPQPTGLAWRRMTEGGPASAARWLIAAEELLFVGAFLAAALIRAYSPAIAGQEKPMDLMFLHALMRAETLPAEDLWLAGYGLPYYYFGYLLLALPGKLLGLAPWVAYNLAVPTVIALAMIMAFAFGANILLLGGASRRAAALGGGLGAYALGVLGNLEALAEALASRGWGDAGFWTGLGLKHAPTASGPGWFPADGVWWFRAARVIPNIQPDGITEFPYFSFLLGDLHPHYMALPLAVLVLALAANRLLTQPSRSGTPPRDPAWTTPPLQIAVEAVVLGAVIPTNTWDVPVLWGAFAGAVILARLRAATAPTWPTVGRCGLGAGLVCLLGLALYAPYFVGYASQPLGLGLVTERTPLGSLAILFGPLLVLPLVGAGMGLAALGGRPFQGRVGMAAAALLTAGLAAFILRELTLGVLVGLVIAWALALWRRTQEGRPAGDVLAAGLVVLGLGAVLAPEVVFLRDVFGTRMNSVFKFYYDAWVVLAVATPLLAAELARAAQRREARPTPAWAARGGLLACGLLMLAGALYPLGATPARSGGFAEPPSLDGLLYLRRARPGDAQLIEWLRAQRAPLRVAEAVGDDYSDAGRFATFGGAATPIGWAGHQLQWRGQVPGLGERMDLVRTLYTDPDEARWRQAGARLGIGLVAVGSLERQLYGAQVASRFEGALEVAHQAGDAVLYHFPGFGRPGQALAGRSEGPTGPMRNGGALSDERLEPAVGSVGAGSGPSESLRGGGASASLPGPARRQRDG